MDPRYQQPDLAALFHRSNTLILWADIERTVAQEQAAMGLIPLEAGATISRLETPTAEAVDQAELLTGHDVAAFLCVARESLPEPGRSYLHHGMTSSDLVDTANAVVYRQAARLILGELAALTDRMHAWVEGHVTAYRVARTHGQAAEPTTLARQCQRLLGALARAGETLDGAVVPMKLSGAVGNYSYNPPSLEMAVALSFGLNIDTAASQVVGRDLYAHFAYSLVRVAQAVEALAMWVRRGAQTGVAELAEPFGGGQIGSTAMPHKRNPIRSERLCGLARMARGYLIPILETAGALWDERDISNSSVERLAMRDLIELVGWMVDEAHELMRGLQFDEDRAEANLKAELDLPTSAARLWLAVRHGAGHDKAYRAIQRGDGWSVPDPSGLAEELEAAANPAWYLRAFGVEQ